MYYSDNEDENDDDPGLSLSDMIYSQASQQNGNKLDPTPGSRSNSIDSKKKSMPASTIPSNHDEEDLIHEFYGLNNNNNNNNTAPIPTKSPSAVRRPIGGRKRKYQTEEFELETQSAADERQRKREEQARYQLLRMRWQEKKYSMDGQVDVGGAVEYMARLVMKQKRKRQPLSKEKQVEIEFNYSDSSEDERQLHLGSLLTNEKEKNRNAVKEVVKEMDYFQKGYAAPRKRDLEFHYGYEHIPPIKQPIKDDDNYPQITKFPYLLRIRTPRIPMQYMTSKAQGNVRAFFLFERTKRSLAAKYLVQCAGLDPNTDNRIIRMLHQSEASMQYPIHREQFLMHYACDQALDLRMLKSQLWKSTAVLSEINTYSNAPILVGCSLDAKSMQQLRRVKRIRLVNLYGSTPIVDRYEGFDDMSAVAPLKNQKEDEKENDAESDSDESSSSSSTSSTSSTSRSSSTTATIGSAATRIAVPTDSTTEGPASTLQNHPNDPSQYVHLAGTKPPIPNFPLDESNIVFGKEDKNLHMGRGCRIETSTYQLTTSTLLCQMASARAKCDEEKVQEIHDLLLSYIEELPVINFRDPTNIMWMNARGIKDIPMLACYRSFMHAFSFFANSGTFGKSIVKAKSTDEVYDDENVGTETETPASLNSLGQRIFDAFEKARTHHGLATFPRVHLVFAIASVARHLPPSAAEIFSRPLDVNTNPFDVVRQTLVHMEENNMLTDDKYQISALRTLHVAQVEHFLHQATIVLQKCMEMDQFEPDYACWHLALLAGSLVLSAGNMIDSGAHTLPSSKKEENLEDIFSQDLGTPEHEIRRMLPKFHETRQHTTDALRDLVDCSRKRPLARASRALCSFLEWKEPVALLVGPSSCRGIKCDNWKQIRRLYAHYFIHWTCSCPAFVRASPFVQELIDQGAAPRNTFVSSLATTLENEPSNIYNWRTFVYALGPIGSKVSEEQRNKCENCFTCKRLRNGFNVDHSRQKGNGWWGEERSWWMDQLLSSSITNKQEEIYQSFIINICRVTTAHINKAVGNEFHAQVLAPDLVDDDDLQLDWIDVSDEEELDSKQERAERTKLHNHELPAFFNDLQNSQQAPEMTSLVPDVTSFHTEISCYKIIIACHLQGFQCKPVLQLTWQLAKASVTGKSKLDQNDSLRCIEWLYQQGLCITQILTDFYESIHTKSKAKNRLSCLKT